MSTKPEERVRLRLLERAAALRKCGLVAGGNAEDVARELEAQAGQLLADMGTVAPTKPAECAGCAVKDASLKALASVLVDTREATTAESIAELASRASSGRRVAERMEAMRAALKQIARERCEDDYEDGRRCDVEHMCPSCAARAALSADEQGGPTDG